MGKTKIEYLDYTWNFVTGCNNWKDPNICGGGGDQFNCWAKAMAERFWPNDFHPRFNMHIVSAPLYRKKPSRIGVCFTGDLFQDGVDPENLFTENLGCYGANGRKLYGADKDYIFSVIEQCPQHQFFFLTKCPWNLHKWGRFPDNAWVGVSITDSEQLWTHCCDLEEVDAAHKWLSIEPLISWDLPSSAASYWFNIAAIEWIVIGGLSNKPASQQPKLEWINEVDAATGCGWDIPVFIKDNLIKAYPDVFSARTDQILPKAVAV